MALLFNHRGALYFVLDEANLERMQANDPFTFSLRDWPKGADPIALMTDLPITIAFLPTSEHHKLSGLSVDEAVAFLMRGYRRTPADETPTKVLTMKPPAPSGSH